MRIFFIVTLHTLIFFIATFGMLHAKTSLPSPDLSNDPGFKAFTKASEEDKFLMLHLYSGSPESELKTTYTNVHSTLLKSLHAVSINRDNSSSSFLIEKYNLRYAPIPLIVIIAPNGAIAGSFQSSFSAEQVKAVFHSPKTQQCLLALQERKLVFISVQNKKTSENTAALDGIKQFEKENPLYRVSEVILLNPKDTSETQLLNQLQIQPDIKTAQTFLLVPPGRIIGSWKGATNSNDLKNRLKSLSKNCSTPSCVDPNCKKPQP